MNNFFVVVSKQKTKEKQSFQQHFQKRPKYISFWMLSANQDKETTAENPHGVHQKAIGFKIKSNSNFLLTLTFNDISQGFTH